MEAGAALVGGFSSAGLSSLEALSGGASAAVAPALGGLVEAVVLELAVVVAAGEGGVAAGAALG